MTIIRQIVEKLCVIITVILLYENSLVFYLYLFPYWWTHGRYLRFFINLIVGHWLIINSVIHYYYAITTSPGFVADLKKEPSKQEELTYTKCPKCDIMRPPRAHHCKVCQKCVVRFDHHCPWINNCVGYRNHVHFLLFCIYIVTITVYAVTVARRQFQLVIFHDQILFGIFAPLLQPQTVATAIAEHGIVGPITGVLTLFMFIIDFAATGLVLALFIWQMSLITKGQTCVEEKIHKAIMTNSVNPVHRQRPYDLGWKQNWRTFFEMNSINELLVRFLFPFLFQPKHDGTQWISKDE